MIPSFAGSLSLLQSRSMVTLVQVILAVDFIMQRNDGIERSLIRRRALLCDEGSQGCKLP